VPVLCGFEQAIRRESRIGAQGVARWEERPLLDAALRVCSIARETYGASRPTCEKTEGGLIAWPEQGQGGSKASAYWRAPLTARA